MSYGKNDPNGLDVVCAQPPVSTRKFQTAYILEGTGGWGGTPTLRTVQVRDFCPDNPAQPNGYGKGIDQVGKKVRCTLTKS